MAKPPYRPGARTRRYSKGGYVEERKAWVTTVIGQMIMMVYPEKTDPEAVNKEPGPTVKVLMPRYRDRTVTWDLTHLTGEEFDMIKEFLALVFDTAEPIIRERDRVAQDALARGDDSFSRVYRQVPQLIIRQGKERAHDEGIQHGPENVSSGDDERGAEDSSGGGVRRTGESLADDDTEQGVSEDDSTTAD